MAENFNDWIPKNDVAKRLHIGIRTLERRIQEQNLRVGYLRVPNRKPLAVMHPDDVATLEGGMVGQVPVLVEEEQETALVPRAAKADLMGLLRLVQATPALPLFLDLKAASAYSGLPQSYLRELIRDGKLNAINRGGWRISRASLEKLAE